MLNMKKLLVLPKVLSTFFLPFLIIHFPEADGHNKFSYFSSGSGPEGSYSKGYYGSEGYDHETSKSKQAADAEGEGFKKGYNMESKHDGADKSNYDSDAASHSGYGQKHLSNEYANDMGKYNRAGHDDGWFNDMHSDGEAKRGGYY